MIIRILEVNAWQLLIQIIAMLKPAGVVLDYVFVVNLRQVLNLGKGLHVFSSLANIRQKNDLESVSFIFQNVRSLN